jgi:two-component system response regulator
VSGPAAGRPIEILLVDDDPGDVLIVMDSLEHSKLTNRIHVVDDGDEALDFLRRAGEHAGAPRPDLVLLDLHLPRRDGRRVLAEIKADPDLRRLPVVVLATSDGERESLRRQGLAADAYVTKPVGFDAIVAVVRSVDHLYLTVVADPAH